MRGLLVLAIGASSIEAQESPQLIAEPGRSVAVSRGATTSSFRIESAKLAETRRIDVVLPSSFDKSGPERRYPVVIVLDGEDNVSPVAAVSDELAHDGQIPEMVIVAIPNRNRLRDLTPPGLSVSGSTLHEGGDRFLDFLEQELLPAVDRQLRGSTPRTLIGHSSGGILATYAAATRTTFRAVLAIDTPVSLGEEWLAKKLMARATAEPEAEPLRYVSHEARFGWPDATWQALVDAAPDSWRLHREKLAHESHESMGMLSMYLGLRELFSDYSMLAAPVSPTTLVLPYYARLGEELGGALVPPRKLLDDVVRDLLAEGNGPAAREAYELLANGYGAPADAEALLAQLAEVEARGSPTETVEGLLATPFPTPEEARAYVGEWVGDITMKQDQPRTGGTTLRVKIEEGRVVGETVRRGPDGKERVTKWEYLRITKSGMTWGNMNGMRPRGVVLFEGTLEGDTLSGKSRFGGIDFRNEEGSKPPPLYFSFRRTRS